MSAVGVIRRHPRGGYTWIWHENWDLTPPPAATECMIEYETYEAARQGAIDAGLAVTIPHFELWDERQDATEPYTCVAHGASAVEHRGQDCARASKECQCSVFEETGLHWDTCPGRDRSGIPPRGFVTFDGLFRDIYQDTLEHQDRLTRLAFEGLKPTTRELADALDRQIKKPEPISPRRAALQEAAGLIEGERDAEYGTPQENFTRAASIWQVLFPERDWTPADVARAMLGIKLARTPHGYKRDSLVDAIGYAAIAVELEETA